jgi:hypothetical protein
MYAAILKAQLFSADLEKLSFNLFIPPISDIEICRVTLAAASRSPAVRVGSNLPLENFFLLLSVRFENSDSHSWRSSQWLACGAPFFW